MADAVTTQVIEDGHRRAIILLTNTSDGTGESAVDKVTPSSLSAGRGGAACTSVKLERIQYDCIGMAAKLLWDATADVTFLVLQGDGDMDFREFGGIPNNAGAGKTGKIQLTTVGHTAGDTYSLILWLVKEYG